MLGRETRVEGMKMRLRCHCQHFLIVFRLLSSFVLEGDELQMQRTMG